MSAATSSTRGRRTARHAPRRRLPGWMGWLALLAFGLRALVPLGFEPDVQARALVLCHEGFPAGFFAHGAAHHDARNGGSATSHCPFCNGTTPALAYAFTGFALRAPYAVALPSSEPASTFSFPLAYTPQARAPPSAV